MSSVNVFPEGLKWIECERGVKGKNSPVRYIPEQDPVQDALKETKKTTYFKLTLPDMGNELKVAVWASGTPEQFLLHGEYAQLRNSKKKKKGSKGDAPGITTEAVLPALAEAKASYDMALKALEAAKLAITMTGAKPFELYQNLLSDKAQQPWEKIIKAQVTRAPWEDIKRVPHMETPMKTWDSFHNPKANQAPKKVLPLDDPDLATHLLRKCPANWQTQNDFTENTTPVSTRALLLVLENIENNAELDAKLSSTTKVKGDDQKRKMESMDSRIPKKPKKVGWTDKHCVLCKKHGGTHKSHNTHDCRRHNKNGTPIKKNGGTGKPHSKERKPEGANVAQIVRAELKKTLRMKSSKRKKRRANDSESDSNSNESS
eukprot:CCRYP_014246-RA/>CCRYP_014246-RA protein AED:0.30 eAED:0.80 QI:0/0/0/1/1/1/3/0/373